MSTELKEDVEAHAGGHHRVQVATRVLGHGMETFSVPRHATLVEVMAEGARLSGFALLPPSEHPFDRLHAMHGEEAGHVIEHLHQTIEEYLRHPDTSPHFAIELVTTFRVNTRWDVATKPEMSPREILALPRIHLDYTEYTLYFPEKKEPILLDTPVPIERGAEFETHRDGRYGGERNMCPDRAREEVADLARRGIKVTLVAVEGQCYALVEGLEAPSPPWHSVRFDILIAIPAAYDAADLDGFYVALPCSFNNGEHPRVNGNIIEALQRKWRAVSWHYPEGEPWKRGQDSLESHIFHCRGFFLQRRAVNAP